MAKDQDELAAAKLQIEALRTELEAANEQIAELEADQENNYRQVSVEDALAFADANPDAVSSTSALLSTAADIYNYLSQ